MRRGSIVRKKGRKKEWFAVVSIPGTGGKKREWHGGYQTELEAERQLTKVLSQQDEGAHVTRNADTVGAFLKGWLEALPARNIRPNTIKSYRIVVTAYLTPRIGDVRLQALTPEKIAGLYGELARSGRRDGKGLGPKSIRNVQIVLHRALEDAVAWGRIARNPSDGQGPRLREGRATTDIETWTYEELNRFLIHSDEDADWVLWHVAAFTGLRRSELLALKWSDLHLKADPPTLEVRRVLVRGSDGLVFEEPKTPRSRRQITIAEPTARVLREHRTRQKRDARWFAGGDYRSDLDLAFARADGTPIRPERITRRFKDLVANCDVRPITFHGLRHTHATLMLAGGTNPKVVTERLGHHSEGFTLRTYAHAMPGMQRDAAEDFAAKVRDANA